MFGDVIKTGTRRTRAVHVALFTSNCQNVDQDFQCRHVVIEEGGNEQIFLPLITKKLTDIICISQGQRPYIIETIHSYTLPMAMI